MSGREGMPHCVTCGQFMNPSAPGSSYRMVIPSDYWNGPEGEQYRCVSCTAKVGPLQPSHGAAIWTAGKVASPVIS